MTAIGRRRAGNAARQAKWRAAQAAQGMVQITVLVHECAVPELKRAVELMAADPHLAVARLVDIRTGRLRGLR